MRLWGRLSFAVALGAALLAAVPSAAAFEFLGLRLFGGEREPPPPDAITYTAELSAPEADRALLRKLRGASQVITNQDEPASSPAALLASARSDYQRILAVLYSEGRYGGEISILVAGRQAADLPADTQLSDGTAVSITVNPGPVYVFGDVSITNRAGPILHDMTLPATPEELGLRSGEPARSTVVLASEDALVGRWREKGHPKARIAESTATANHADDELSVRMRVAPGREANFGPTSVRGTDRMDPEFVAYYADIPEGERFDPDDLERAQDQMRRLEVFQAVRIVEADRVQDNGTLPITVRVVERKTRVIGGGVEISSVDGLGLQGYWRHRNLFGRAERLSLEASASDINGDNPDTYNYSLGAAILKPGVFTPYTDLAARVYAEQLSPETYRSRTVGARVGLQHRIGKRLTAEVFGQVEASTIDRTSVGDGEFLMVSLPSALTYDATDNPLDATRGYKVRVKAEPFVETVNSNVGLITEAEVSTYRALGSDRLVLALRGQVGSIVGAPQDEIPANRLFFTGGGGSIRGYVYQGVGPTDRNGDVVGGRSFVTGSAEARFRINEQFGFVPFVDVGNAFADELPDFSEPLAVGVGAGIRYYTGLGPIRLDVAVPLNEVGNEPDFAFYIGLGQSF
ncbi:MAG: autotransporter assembly complex family protein [Pseudomonadota bacterium]